MRATATAGLCYMAALVPPSTGVQTTRYFAKAPGGAELDVYAGLTWLVDHNFTGWNAALGEPRGTASVSPVAAPARLSDFSGLAPAYIEVGDLDIFRDESISYAQRLARAGAPVELQSTPVRRTDSSASPRQRKSPNEL